MKCQLKMFCLKHAQVMRLRQAISSLPEAIFCFELEIDAGLSFLDLRAPSSRLADHDNRNFC